jgi:hypothetical protein
MLKKRGANVLEHMYKTSSPMRMLEWDGSVKIKTRTNKTPQTKMKLTSAIFGIYWINVHVSIGRL